MIINKITTGFVVQQYDTELQTWISQEFIAGEDVQYEYADLLSEYPNQDPAEMMNESNDGTEPYLPFEMVQPE